jgi:hypothetical protein
MMLGGATSFQPSSFMAQLRNALITKYPKAEEGFHGKLKFNPKTPIERLDLPALKKALPTIRFFYTLLETPYAEYSRVEAIIAVTGTSEAIKIETGLSPTYTTVAPSFLNLFVGARASSSRVQTAVARDVFKLFAKITYKGTIRSQRIEGKKYLAELWNAEICCGLITVTFNNDGIDSVRLTNPQQATSAPDK